MSASPPATAVLWDWPHREDIRGEALDDVLRERGGCYEALGRISLTRGIVLWLLATERAVTVIGFAGNATRVFFLLERIFGGRRRHVVVLHFIPEIALRRPAGPRELISPQFWIRAAKLPYLRWVVRPAMQRAVLSCQVLTSWELTRNAAWFGMPESRMVLLRYPLKTDADALPAEAAPRAGVMASGRAACDWPTVFRIAAGEEWPLTVVCGQKELREVQRLNAGGRASVLCDIASDEHFRLLTRSEVYVLALHDVEASSGQIRLSDAVRAGTPIVASRTVGTAEYIEDERAVLSFEPGDAETARAHVRMLLADHERWQRQRTAAFEGAAAWSRESYRAGLQRMVADAAAEAAARTRTETAR
jgi:hypothetical protein